MILFSLPGVQRYIAESRKTSDLVSASAQMAALTYAALQVLADAGDVVIPASAGSDPATAVVCLNGEAAAIPNRIVALVPAGQGPDVAMYAAEAVHALWASWVGVAFPGERPRARGFPSPQWVCLPAQPGGYAEQFLAAGRALAARRRLRDFDPVLERGKVLCSLTGRWPVVSPPSGASARFRPRRDEADERLSEVAWVKRLALHVSSRPSTPSTAAIASAPYRAAVLTELAAPLGDRKRALAAALVALHAAGQGCSTAEVAVPGLEVPSGLEPSLRRAADWLVESGGSWVHPDQWNSATVDAARADRPGSSAGMKDVDIREGRRAADALAKGMGRLPGTHLAVIVQDLDDMGSFLGGGVAGWNGRVIDVSADEHARVSGLLRDVAVHQVAIADGREADAGHGRPFAIPVYAGGDDVMVLAAASTALDVAVRLHDAVPVDLRPPSTAVLYFQRQASLRRAIAQARSLLDQAKDLSGKHALALGYVRRSGSGHSTVMSWTAQEYGARAVVAALGGSSGRSRELSPRLVADLERDRAELAGLLDLPNGRSLLLAELTRLVARHGPQTAKTEHARELGRLLLDAGRHEANPAQGADGFDPVPAARLAVFLRQEAR